MKSWKARSVAVFAVFSMVGAIYVWHTSAIEVPVAQPEQKIEVRVFGVGTVEAQILSRIGFQIQGRIIELTADQGDLVAAGSLLARLDDAAQAARVRKAEVAGMQSESVLAKSTAQKERADIAYRQRQSVNMRRQMLVDRGTVSRETAEDSQASEEIAKADAAIAGTDVAVARAAKEDAAAQRRLEDIFLDQHILRAPFNARVVARLKEGGSIANVGEPIFTLIEPSSIWVRAFIDEARSGSIAIGQTAWVRLRSEPFVVFEAEVVRIDQENDRVTEERRIYVRCRACQPDHQTRFLGEQAEVEIVTRTISSGIFVPARIIDSFDGKHGFIWTLEKERLERRRIEFGARLLDGRLEIASGLAEGALPLTNLHPGIRVGRSARALAQGEIR